MQRRIRLRIRNLQISGAVNPAQLSGAVGSVVSRALTTEAAGVARSVTQATTREVSARVGSHPGAGKIR